MTVPARSGAAGMLGLAFALAPVLLSAFVYYPITRNFFHGDDFLNLYEIANGDLAPFLLRMHGGHLLMSSNALFALLFGVFGADPAPYHWLAFVTHLLNVALLFALLRRLTGSPALACFGAALWGTLPVNEGSLGWYSVYGHVMATTCVLAALLMLARTADAAPRRILAVLLLLVVAGTSFGVGLGVTMAMPAVAFLLLPPGAARRRAVFAFLVLAAATPIAYFGAQNFSTTAYGRSPAMAYQLTAQRYWMNSLHLLLELFSYGVACLALGMVHRPLPAGELAIAGGLFALAAAVMLMRADGRTRGRVLAFLLVAASAYAVVAAGRAMVGRGSRAALMAGSPRFHYLAVAALVVAVCLLLMGVARRIPRLARVGRVLLPAWIAGVLVVHAWRGPVLPGYSYCRTETMQVLADIRSAVAAAPGENVHIDNRGFKCIGPMLYAARHRFPGWAGVFALYFPTNVVEGRRVYFLESNALALERASRGRRTAGLMVSYEDVGRSPPAPEAPPRGGARARSAPVRGSTE